ncbi:hypothetical protein NDN08_007824 [Rhodosorus marinus]|uniref:Cytochrome b5 heme-binding domain-containing protein n=1 Tax=Rhodosorus marinus TaxID=101924 RepID=A0AAV8V2R5_9RHOD|nr:hypothetical protein NDN08_007824 [Rhodosorus marinus]
MCIGNDDGVRLRRARPVTLAELSKHDLKEDSWVAIRGRVYDVTEFGSKHPGGEILYTASGTDATGVFNAFHPKSTWNLLKDFYVGELKDDRSQQAKEYDADIARMRIELQRLHAFESSKLYYVWLVARNLLILTPGVALVMGFPNNPFLLLLASFLVGLFFQQCGWLCHDVCHHQLFKKRALNNMVGLLIGNLFQGFSVSWWKNKHNHHHAVPNVTETCAGGDPDIHTLPMLLWSEKLLEGEDLDRLPLFLVRNQWLFYFPFLCLARMSWLSQSIIYMTEPSTVFIGGRAMKTAEIIGLALHHLLMFTLAWQIPSWALAILFYCCAQATGGLLIGIVFTVGHNAMEVLTEDEMKTTDFVRLQLRTTRNVTPSWFTDFFTGGLNYQVEHHIWPTLPRHNLPEASRILKELCAKHDLAYHCMSLYEGNEEVCRFIRRMSSLDEVKKRA